MMLVSLSLSACSGSDNNDGDDDNRKTNSVVGTWMGYFCADSNPNDLSKNHTLTLVFNSDGSGSYLEIDGSYTDKCSFVFQMEGDARGKTYTKRTVPFV